MTEFKVDKTKLVDTMGRPLTQGLFLEIGYNTDFAVYTLAENDKKYKGKLYPSLKRLYIEHEDPVEFDFARTYLLGWKHWERLNNNTVLRKHFDEWRYELELSIRSSAVREIIDKSMGESGFQASKWLADKGWSKKGPGRPSKDEQAQEEAMMKRIQKDFNSDIERLKVIK